MSLPVSKNPVLTLIKFLYVSLLIYSLSACATVQLVDREIIASPLMSLETPSHVGLQTRGIEKSPWNGGGSYGGCLTCGP